MKLTEEDIECCYGGRKSFVDGIVVTGNPEEIKQQILESQEKAEKWDELNQLGDLDVTRLAMLYQENKQLKEIVEKIKQFGGNSPGIDREWAFDQIYQQICKLTKEGES